VVTYDVVLTGTVRDVLVRRPKVSPSDSRVGDVRALLADDHVHMVLLVDADGRLVGTVVGDDLAPDASDDAPALSLARLEGRTVPAELAAADALRQLVAAGVRRAAVVEDDGRLVGLLCLKRSGTGFCGDDDVAARRRLGPR
jgi:CBS-domain-containing membrane protein